MSPANEMKSTLFWSVFLLLALVQGIAGNDNGDRISCFPLPVQLVNRQICEENGCVWDGLAENINCFLYTDGSQSYGYEILTTPVTAPNGLTVNLRRRRLSGGNTPPSLYGGDVDEVTFEVTYYSDQTLGFAFYPRGANKETLRPPVRITLPQAGVSNPLYNVRLISSVIGQPFDFQIIRRSTGAVLFDTSLGGLTIAEQFLMITTKLPTDNLYGFGENTHDRFKHDMNYRMWPIFTRDISPIDEDVNLYGAHPFYMVSEQDGSSHGVFFYNSHSIDVTTMPYPGITLRTIGGMLEFFVFLGPQPETVVQQYTAVIGKTFLPPYFSLGFQLSRWGYKNTQEIRDVIARTRAVQIPQDVQYADIDYMDGKRDFTIDPVNFGDLPALVDEVKVDGVRFVVILDPAIASDYVSYERGKAANAYVVWANSTIKPPGQPTDSDIILGNVWPDARTAFPDFFKSSTKLWWTDEIQRFYQNLKFDALWIDMNEVSNFDTNVYPDKLQCPTNKWDDPPYPTKASVLGPVDRLSDKTICMATKFGENGEYLHYNVHNLYGQTQAIATQSAVRQVLGKRSMVFSRSSFAGSGQYSGHWLGDNFSVWKNMKDSVIGMLEFNIFGIPYIGADICGFIFDTTEELCERWMELGAFYPFSRNHNNIGNIPQDPGQWPNTVASSGRKAFNIRYRLLPYLYTLFYDSHTTGSTVARPLYHEYPTDEVAKSVTSQFLWGAAFLITPVLDEGRTSVLAYFPDDVWYDYYTGAQVLVSGQVTSLNAPRDVINLHLRGGYILPAQKPGLNTMLSRQNNFELLVSLKNNQASGKLFWDDGESIDTIQSGLYQINRFEFDNNVLTITATKGSPNFGGIGPNLDLIEINGYPARPTSITIDGVAVNAVDYTYSTATRRLILLCNLSMNNNHLINFLL